MDLSTTYLGLKLPHPFVPGASPLAQDLDGIRRLADGGAAAIVLPSLFEEQIIKESLATSDAMDTPANQFAEALSYFPEPDDFRVGSHEYLELVRKAKTAVRVPVIASLNGVTAGGWLEYARLIEQAGADALELNIYQLSTDPDEDARAVEHRKIEVLREVKRNVKVPVAVKISPFYSSLANFASRLAEAGADGLVIFNRFYQPDINIEQLEVERRLHLSDSSELLVRLRWLAVLSGRVEISLACSGGVHGVRDAIKAIMAGAHVVQMVSALLRQGPGLLETIRRELAEWLEKHEYASLQQMQGSMNLVRSPDVSAYERANYMRILQSWQKA